MSIVEMQGVCGQCHKNIVKYDSVDGVAALHLTCTACLYENSHAMWLYNNKERIERIAVEFHKARVMADHAYDLSHDAAIDSAIRFCMAIDKAIP
jgi:hypothetical protein